MGKRDDESDLAGYLPLKPVEFLVLVVLSQGARHGYGIVREMDELTRGAVKVRPGDLYRVLYRLNRRGLVATAGRKGQPEKDERRTYYDITELGRRVLRAEAELLSEIAASVMSS